MKIADIEDLPDTSPPPSKRSTSLAKQPIKRPPVKQQQIKKKADEEEKPKRNRERENYSYHLPQPPLSQPEKLWMTRKPEDFFEYFRSLEEFWTPENEVENTQPLIRCYVYRKWPQIDNGMVGNKNSYIDRWHTWPFWDTGQSGSEEPKLIEDFRMGMLSKWGSGMYKITMVDVIANKPIAELTEWVNRPENINLFPPILNYKTLLTGVNENKDYITWRQQTGLPLPGELSEEQTMAMGSPVQDKMMEKVIERAFEEKPAVIAQPQSTAAGDAAAVASVQLMANVVDKLMNKPEPPPQPQQSPHDAITLAVTLIEKLQPKGNSEVMEMIREDRENTRRENAELRKQLLEANRPKGLKEQLEELNALRELMGGNAPRPVMRKAEEPSFLDKHGTTILQLGTSLLGAWMQQQQMQTSGKLPMQHQQAVPQAMETTVPMQPPQQPPVQPMQQQPAQHHQTSASEQRNEEREAEGETSVNVIVKAVQGYLDPIALPLFNHLKDAEGEDFADWLIGGFGEDTYKQAAALEFGVLVEAISTHPVIGRAIAEHGIAIERLGTFIEHFKNPEKYWVDEEEEVKEEAEEGDGKIESITKGKSKLPQGA